MIRFSCPNCEAKLAAPPEKIGASSTCHYCHAPVSVPAAGTIGSPIPESLRDEPAEPSAQLRGSFSPAFLDGLKAVHDADTEKDPDECVPILAGLFDRRRTAIRESRLGFLAGMKAVYESEVGIDPEDLLPLLASHLSEWRFRSVRQMREYLSELPEDDPLRCPISLFSTLGLGRLETAHTNALAWLLAPTQSHGFATSLIDALLVHLTQSETPSKVLVKEMLKEHRVVLGGEYLGRVDVYGTGSWTTSDGTAGGWLLVIEAKIDASEGDKQLERYSKWIDAHRGNREALRIFLTPEGRRPEAEVSDWTALSFLDLVRIFREPYLQLRDRPGFHFLRFYLAGILKDVYRWKLPVGDPESCDDPYGFVDYLKTVHSSSRGGRHDRVG